MRILDLFCGAGGAAWGLHLAFPHAEIYGVDIEKQPRYPFRFYRADVFEWAAFEWREFDYVWASPKCQRYSTMTKKWGRSEEHENQIPFVKQKLTRSGVPWTIENVPQAPLDNPVILCGSMFGLKVRRHRAFESSFSVPRLECRHDLQPEVVGVYGHSGGKSIRDGLTFKGTDAWREAMGINWMIGNELAQAVPPAYSNYIAKHL